MTKADRRRARVTEGHRKNIQIPLKVVHEKLPTHRIGRMRVTKRK